MTWLLVAVSAALGAALAVLVTRARGTVEPPSRPANQTSVDESAGDVTAGGTGTPWKAVLDALPIGVIAVDRDGREIARNVVADSIATAAHGQVLVEAACARLLARGRDGVADSETVELIGPPIQVLEVRSHVVASGTMLTVTDVTERVRIDQARTDLVANISHELKTPVGAMSVLAESLAGGSDDEMVGRLARRIVDESQRMARTIEDLLELSRIEMGVGTAAEPVDLARVAEEAIERVRPLAGRQGVEIVLEADHGTGVEGDHQQLVSAVGNLVDNAVNYSPDSGEVRVAVARRGGSVMVEVTDRGIGIPAAELEKIFQRFYRVDRARSRTTGGTGLGLSIVRHVATNHGAEVEVVSREGEGSTFRLIVPARRGGG